MIGSDEAISDKGGPDARTLRQTKSLLETHKPLVTGSRVRMGELGFESAVTWAFSPIAVTLYNRRLARAVAAIEARKARERSQRRFA